MKKIALVSILILILFTSLIKNSTKKIEDKIYIVNENIETLKEEFGNLMLEYNYLSSPKKLIQHQSEYFENDLVKTDITKIKKITTNNGYLEVTDLINKIKINE
tara:strand:- start:81 stop:392 length:312 start_codon:yes stop_codon:yes gene_type:complete